MSWNRNPKQDLQEDEKVYPAALRILGRRDHGEKELRQKLKARGAATAAIDESIDRLKDLGYLNEARLIADRISYRLRYQPRGRLALRQELRARGLDPELIEHYLEELYPPEQEREILQQAVRKEAERQFRLAREKQSKLDLPPELDALTRRKLLQRLARKFAQQGYPTGQVYEALQGFAAEDMD